MGETRFGVADRSRSCVAALHVCENVTGEALDPGAASAAIRSLKEGVTGNLRLPVQEGGRETALGLCPGNSDSLRMGVPPNQQFT